MADHVNIDELDDIVAERGSEEASARWEAREIWRALDAKTTGALHLRLHPGRRSPFTHRHECVEELYLILSGTGRVNIDGEIRDVRPRDAIRVLPTVNRAFEAGPDGLEILAFGPRADDGVPVAVAWTDDDPT
jgi:mannose-6-phosphate isomerase-like protein (cupin superfamily)